MAFAEIYNKGGTDKTCIVNVRTGLIQPFQAPNWMDLRIGWFLSITDKTNDDLITGLAETIGTEPRPVLSFVDRYAIGLTDKVARHTFLGFTNVGRPRTNPSIGSSKLISSDGGIGTSNTNFWRVKNEINDGWSAMILDRSIMRAGSTGGIQQHFVQNAGGAGGYATLSMIRFRRDTPTSRIITMTIKQGTNSSDILYSNTPTVDILQTNLEAFPAGVQQLGPVELSAAPDAFFYQWPFANSRLRIHAVGFLKAG